jgi:hypothetical protein
LAQKVKELRSGGTTQSEVKINALGQGIHLSLAIAHFSGIGFNLLLLDLTLINTTNF